jgi:hypothetical protein
MAMLLFVFVLQAAGMRKGWAIYSHVAIIPELMLFSALRRQFPHIDLGMFLTPATEHTTSPTMIHTCAQLTLDRSASATSTVAYPTQPP